MPQHLTPISSIFKVSSILLDNGTNFVGEEEELKQAILSLTHNKIHQALQERGVAQHFNPPAASHHCGIWERLVGIIKKILKSVLRHRMIVVSVHSCVKQRLFLMIAQITKPSDDPTDLEALTPNNLLLLKAKSPLPPGLFVQGDFYVKRRWRQVHYLANLLWKQWVREDLPLLQERQQWNKRKNNLKPTDIVLIMDPTAPPFSLPLGRYKC